MAVERSNHGIPRAQVVRDGSAPIPKHGLRDSVKDTYQRAEPTFNLILYYVVGLWPLVLVTLVTALLLWKAGYQDPTMGR